MGYVSALKNAAERRLSLVATICAKMLLLLCRLLEDYAIKNGFKLAHIMPVRSGYDDGQRDATTVHQDMTLAPVFFPDPSGSSLRFQEPLELCTFRHLCFATPKLSFPSRHTQPALDAK